MRPFLHRAASNSTGIAGALGLVLLIGPAIEAQAPPRATVRVEQNFGLAAVTWWAELTRDGSLVTGAMWVETGDVNRALVRRDFGCRLRRLAGPDRERWRCRVPFTHGEPTWAELWRTLDLAGVTAPPAATDRSASDESVDGRRTIRMTSCQDGSPWATTWRGTPPGMVEDIEVRTAQGCGSMSPERQAFELQVTRVLEALLLAADPTPTP